MEYAAGGELYDYLSERKVLTELEARRVFRQVASAVYYCHKVGLSREEIRLLFMVFSSCWGMEQFQSSFRADLGDRAVSEQFQSIFRAFSEQFQSSIEG